MWGCVGCAGVVGAGSGMNGRRENVRVGGVQRLGGRRGGGGGVMGVVRGGGVDM